MLAPPKARPGSPLRVALTASAGATIEWYDFFIYGTAAALVFPQLFFPADLPPFIAQIGAFATFAVGFLARPVGGVVFGHFGDVVGRKRALVTALVVMGIATAAIGVLPSYATAGVAAPLMLVALRFVQGFAVGGQWGGAALLAIESAPAHRRGYFGSFVQIGVPLGVIVANVVFLIMGALLTPEGFLEWGWRVPFIASLLLVGVGLYVQLNLEESVEFETRGASNEHAAPAKSPILAVLASHPAEVLLAGGAFIANNTCFYIAITYVVAYGTATLQLSRAAMLTAVMVGSAVMIPALILCGAISDRWGRRPPFVWGAALSGLWAFAFFPMIETGSPGAIVLAVSLSLIFISMMYGPQAALFAELFPVEVRYSGASLGYQLGSVLGGGLAPIVATALFEQFHSSMPISIYLAATCVISLVCTVILGLRARQGAGL